jgi:electron transport complex protein RnfB
MLRIFDAQLCSATKHGDCILKKEVRWRRDSTPKTFLPKKEKVMNENTYRKLADHLDRLPGGFPPSTTGADLRLLQKLFAPEEAKLAVHLTLDRETAEAIAKRSRMPVEKVTTKLEVMAQKGVILNSQAPDGTWLYQAVPLVVGIYELQINNLSQELLNAFYDYWSSTVDRPDVETIPQMRTIPIGESIQQNSQALPYEQVNELVKTNDRFAVTICICRRNAKMRGEGCNAPEESCLVFGDWADYYVRTGRGKSINRAEVMEILAKADQANLVLRPSNSREIEFICCCCGCCCGGLVGLRSHPRPADVVASAYIARLDSAICQGCWTCIERCQMDALVEDFDHVRLKSERCIGCGLCVTTCPSGALSLERKPDNTRTRVPQTLDDTWRIIVQDQAK